jgi:Ca-activated chloride channel family protein
MKPLHVLPILALLVAASLPLGRSVHVTGRVTDAATGLPLAGASIAVDATSFGTLTGHDGTYRLTLPASLRGGSRTVTAAMIGYGTARRAARLDGDSVRVDFALSAQVVALEELAATGAADAAGRAEYQRKAAVPQASVAALAHAPAPPGLRVPETDADIRVRREPWNTESYDLIEDNAFRAVRTNPLSTFSIDVDRAAYSNVRRFLEGGQMPPRDAVRIEEMINYFHYTNAQPRGREPFAVTTELMAAPWQPRHGLLRISLQARSIDTRELPPSNLVFLLDVSGSMTSPDKLPLLKQAMRLLVDELRPQDRVAIVVYAGSSGLVLASTPGTHKARITRALDALEAGGSTAGGAGIRLAYDVARENHIEGGNNRVVLATDGDFNVGVSSDAEMVRLIEEKRRHGTFLTVLGFGTGNLKDSKMEKLADHGNGNYAYIDDLREARKVLVTEMGGTLHTIAKDVKLQVEFNPAHVRAYRLIGYENRVLAAEDFDDDRKDAGELGAGHTVTALYEIVPVGVEGTVDVREASALRYQAPPVRATSGRELAFVKLRYKEPDGATSRLLDRPVRAGNGAASSDMRFAASVAAFGMLLRESEHRGAATYDDVLALARGSLGDDAEGYRAEFVRLVERARALTGPVADGSN